MRTILEKLHNFLKNWAELWQIPLSFLAFFAFPIVMAMMGINVGGISLSVLQVAFAASFYLFIGSFTIWLVYYTTFRTFKRYLRSDKFKFDFEKLEPKTKIWLTVCPIFVLFLTYALLALAVV